MAYAVNNFGATTNLTNISEYLENVEHIPVKKQTISGYPSLLSNAKLLCRCPRFDLKSRRSLRGEEKYYLADPSIYRARNTNARVNYGPALENALYAHLLSKGYSVSVGRIGKLECDFIARKADAYSYVQVAMTVSDPEVERREYAPLLEDPGRVAALPVHTGPASQPARRRAPSEPDGFPEIGRGAVGNTT